MIRFNERGLTEIQMVNGDRIVSKLSPVIARTEHLLWTEYWQNIATDEGLVTCDPAGTVVNVKWQIHEVKGECTYCFVSLCEGLEFTE